MLTDSTRRKLLATGLVAMAFVLLSQAHVLDSKRVSDLDPPAAAAPGALGVGSSLAVVATAYCKGHTTASGAAVKAGMVAGDPKVLPLGSIVEVSGLPERYVGVYSVLDTGPKVKGRRIDVYMWSCIEALAFGRRKATVKIVRLGWKPNNQP